ncbi:MAG: HAD-IA family hydrolase [Acidobacteria bacterium]|nr:HAD-IA family hydrolase [Acidobacteriota bacterium]
MGAAKVHLFLLDLDGTLIDSRADIVYSANSMRLQMGFPPLEFHSIAPFVGGGIGPLMEHAFPTADGELLERAIPLFRQHYQRNCLERTRLYPGVAETLKALRIPGNHLAVLTNKPLHLSEKILRGLGAFDLFDAVVGGDSLGNKKPHPEPFLHLVEKFRVPRHQAMIVGDMPADMEGGRSAGILTCGVTYGIGDPENLRPTKPDFWIHSFPELIRFV